VFRENLKTSLNDQASFENTPAVGDLIYFVKSLRMILRWYIGFHESPQDEDWLVWILDQPACHG
jgi:hypothetical protein